MTAQEECCECGFTVEGCRQISSFEPGDGWYIVKMMSGDIVESIKERWEGRYICPQCYQFEVTVMHSKIKLSSMPACPVQRPV
jgi:hypothetical protein